MHMHITSAGSAAAAAAPVGASAACTSADVHQAASAASRFYKTIEYDNMNTICHEANNINKYWNYMRCVKDPYASTVPLSDISQNQYFYEQACKKAPAGQTSWKKSIFDKMEWHIR